MTGKGGRREVSDAMMRSVGIVVEADQRERSRVADLLCRDREEAKAEERRRAAEIEVAEGKFVNFEDLPVKPTPEQFAKGEYQTRIEDSPDGSIRSVAVLRRVTDLRIVQLHRRGVIDDDLFAACRWYRNIWERSGLAGGVAISSYDTDPRGYREYGVMARTEMQAEARANYRWARNELISDVPRVVFEMVVLDEVGLTEAGIALGCGKSTARKRFLFAASELHMGIAHLLPIR